MQQLSVVEVDLKASVPIHVCILFYISLCRGLH